MKELFIKNFIARGYPYKYIKEAITKCLKRNHDAMPNNVKKKVIPLIIEFDSRFPEVVPLAFKKRGGRRNNPTPIDSLCNLWCKGDHATLWNMAKSRRVTGPLARTNSDDSVPRNLIDFAVSLSHEGMFAKACRILVSSGLAPNNEDTWKLIREKHPEGPLPIIPETTSAQSISLNDDFDVYNILKSFPKGTAAGPSGLRVQHLLDAASIPLPTTIGSLLRRVVNLLVSGKVPQEVSLFMAGGSLTALSKLKPGCAPDIRPIAVGEVLRRFASMGCLVLWLSPFFVAHYGSANITIRLSYLARSTPTDLVLEAFKLFDDDIHHCFMDCIGFATSDEAWCQAQLGLNSGGLGLHLDPIEFRVAVKWWLGLDTSQGSQCAFCPAHSLDPLGHHALTCKCGGDAVLRHNALRDTLVHFLHRAHASVQVEVGAGLFPDHSQSRPADILLQNWNLGRPVALDISVVSPLNPSTLAEAGATFGAVLEATESRKHQANDEKCSALGWVSTPLAVDSYGAWGKEATLFLAQVAARLAIHKSLPKSQASFDLFSNLSICLIRANARAILRRV
eukprot:Em0001g639a